MMETSYNAASFSHLTDIHYPQVQSQMYYTTKSEPQSPVSSVSSPVANYSSSIASYSSPDISDHSKPSPTAQRSYSMRAPTAVRRNERERNRVKLVNLGFNTLRQHVPSGAKNKKMSKVETLRAAVEYIKTLQEVLDSQQG